MLGYYTLDKWMLTGTADINMGPFVGQGEIRREFSFEGETATDNAKVECTFNIYQTGNEPSNRASTEVGGGMFKKVGSLGSGLDMVSEENKETMMKGKEAMQ